MCMESAKCTTQQKNFREQRLLALVFQYLTMKLGTQVHIIALATVTGLQWSQPTFHFQRTIYEFVNNVTDLCPLLEWDRSNKLWL